MPPTIRVEPKELAVVEGATIVLNASITGAEPVVASVRLYGPQQLDNVRVNSGERTIEIRGVLIYGLRDEDHGASKNKVQDIELFLKKSEKLTHIPQKNEENFFHL